MINFLNVFSTQVEEEVFFTLEAQSQRDSCSWFPLMKAKSRLLFGSDDELSHHQKDVPILGFPSSSNLHAKLKTLVSETFSSDPTILQVELGELVMNEEMGFIGYKLVFHSKFQQLLDSLKKELSKKYDVDVKYYNRLREPSLVIAKNLAPSSFRYFIKKIEKTKPSISFNKLTFNMRRGVKRSKSLISLDLG